MTGTYGIEAFVRSSPPAGARDPAARTVGRLRGLVEAGRVDECSVHRWGRTVDSGAAPPCSETGDLLFDRVGMRTALVLSGVTDRDDLETAPIQPDHVVESLADIEEVLS